MRSALTALEILPGGYWHMTFNNISHQFLAPLSIDEAKEETR